MVGQVVTTMESISNSSRQIADILRIIDNIAFQTNILALNASVEAARAGEQGRGFAVVASEVRALAQKSAQAAKEIKTLIDTTVDNISNGSVLVTNAGKNMEEILESIRHVVDIVDQITTATQTQRSGIEHINVAVREIDTITRQNAQLASHVTDSAADMRSHAEEVTDIMESVAGNNTETHASLSYATRPVALLR